MRYRRIYRGGAGGSHPLKRPAEAGVRGYDSAGVAVYNSTGLHVVKSKGRLSRAGGHFGGRQKPARHSGHWPYPLGHPRRPQRCKLPPSGQRWGQVRGGAPTGIIENYLELKNRLMGRGVEFASDTDTEVVAQLLEYYYTGDVLEAIQKVIARVEGS